MQIQNFDGSEAPSPTLSKKIKNFVFSQKDQIGKGYSSVVYRGIDDITKEDIAVKVVELNKIKNEVQRHLLNNEMRALRKLQHPYILRCLDILMTKNNIYIVTEFCRTGDMVSLIRQNGRLPELQALTYLKEIAEGYVFIEENGILHRDLKTANIFLNGGSTRIADFGFCEFVGEPRPSIAYNVGSPAYMSPESYRESYYSNKSDVWSIGVIFYEMLMGEVPFKKSDYVELVQNLTNGNLGIPPGISVSDGSRNILIGCFKQKINQRVEPKKLLEMVNTQLKMRQTQKVNIVPVQTLRSSFDMNSSPPPRQQIETQRILQSGGPPSKLHQQPPPYHMPSIILNGQKFATSPHKNVDFNEIQAQSQMVQYKVQTQTVKHYIEYTMFLYRLSKICLESVNIMSLDHYINQIFLIILKNRNQMYSEIDPLLAVSDPVSNKQFQYLKSRFEELGLAVEQFESVDQNLKNLLNSAPFKSEASLKLCLYQLKTLIGQLDRFMDQNTQVAGVLMDYLMIYHELLAVQIVGTNIDEVIRISHLPQILKERPKTLSQTHVRLLRIKRSLLGL